MRIDRIGVHESVSALFPPERLRSAVEFDQVEAIVVDDTSLGECDAIVTLAYTPKFLRAGIHWIHSVQSGVDRFPLAELGENDIVLTNSAGIHRDSVGETCVGYVMAFSRGLDQHMRHQSRGEWSRPGWDELFTATGETACVIGLGALGRGIAERLHALGLRVIGVRKTPEQPPFVERVEPPARIDSAITDARFVVLAVPLTEETEHLVDEALLTRMRDDAFLINVARGGVVDEAALIHALRSEEIAGAALDVFETEPLPQESPLWDLDRVIITPHTAGLSGRYYEDVATIVRENVLKLRNREDPRNLVESK